jgi:hypothetical protein
MLSQDLLDELAADRQREVERNLRVRALLGRPHRARSLAGVARKLRHTIAGIGRR